MKTTEELVAEALVVRVDPPEVVAKRKRDLDDMIARAELVRNTPVIKEKPNADKDRGL